MEHKIKFYPVGNADCILVKLENGKTIIVDCQIKKAYDDKGKTICFDVKKDLLQELKRDKDGHPFVDLYISTHPHQDHSVGFGDNFFHGDPKDYNDKDNQTIIIGELWVTPYAFKDNVCDASIDIRREAKRRRGLYDCDKKYVGTYGNYLHVIGYDKDKDFDKRYGYVPGIAVTNLNGGELAYVEIFIHAPFKDDVQVAKDEKDQNAVSIVIQLSFATKKEKNIAKILLGGDAEYQIWQHILENNQNKETLQWDVFLAPHHCSWTFFNDTINKEEVQSSATKILSMRRNDEAYIVASSDEIKDEEPNPPHYEAMKQYKRSLKNKLHFLNTATHFAIKGIPCPIILGITEKGVIYKNASVDKEEAAQFKEALSSGTLKISPSGALSLTTGKTAAASKGFYGKKEKL